MKAPSFWEIVLLFSSSSDTPKSIIVSPDGSLEAAVSYKIDIN